MTDKLHYIEFRHVYKTFDRPVLVDANFYVNAGETVAIIGRSGVGKSVSLGHIMGFLKPDQGRVFVAYQDITDFTEAQLREIRKKVTMVFQSGALFDSLTVGENILFSLELRDDYDEHNKEDVVDGLLSMVDMLQFKDAYPADLSTGYKRAVAIARALAAQPECILYDEPTTMVDPIMSDILAQLMLKLKRELKLTAVVVTHDLDLMRKVADTVVVLYQGRGDLFWPGGGSGEVHASRTFKRSWRWTAWSWFRTWPSSFAPLLNLLEIQRRRVHAVALLGRLGAVVEDVAQVRIALAAQHLHAPHAVAGVRLHPDVFRRYGRPEAGPSGARIVLGVRMEQRRAAADALVRAGFVIVPMFAGERRLGAFRARDRVLLGR